MIPSPHNPPGTPTIHFTQFLFPNRTQRDEWIEVPQVIFNMAKDLASVGFKFEIENQNERIWMSCIHHIREISVDRFCDNGPDVPDNVHQLVRIAHRLYILKKLQGDPE